MFENRVLRRIFGPKRDEVIGGWEKLHNEKLHNFHSSPNIIRKFKSRKIRRTRHIARMGPRGMHIGNLEGTRPLGRPRRRWKIILKYF
jgi:hypothetical protein